jgi:crotonobetainyl-CoA:carnitine CoA-transferase CaiB-like acyl-CoA transferase
MTLEMAHGSGATVKVIANPVKLSATPPTYRSAPPVLGEHTDEVLTGVLGMGAEEIAALRAKAVL